LPKLDWPTPTRRPTSSPTLDRSADASMTSAAILAPADHHRPSRRRNPPSWAHSPRPSLRSLLPHTLMAAPTILDVFSAGRGVHILDAIGNLKVPCVLSAPAETAAGLSYTRPVVPSPSTATLTAPAGTIATGPSSITVSGVHRGQKVSQADEDLHVADESGRGHSIGRKSWTPGSALPLHATSRQLVSDVGGSRSVTQAESSIHSHRAHPGPKEHYIGDDRPNHHDALHFVSLPPGALLSAPAEVGLLEYVDPSYAAAALSEPSETRHGESRIRLAFPQLHSPEKGCNG
jgi:hypothetical protein